MVKHNHDAFICDLAETYHIYDYRAHPPFYVGALLRGLRGNSRTKMEITGQPVPLETIILVSILDGINWLRWTKSKQKQAPKPLLDIILNKTPKEKVTAFDSAEEFERRRMEILNNGN